MLGVEGFIDAGSGRVRTKVTCTLIVRNEYDRVERAIRSVRNIVDEILVIDSGSTDGTVALCESLGARVIYNPWIGFGPQKRFAEDRASNDWILNIDADEWLSAPLQKELEAALSRSLPPTRSFRVRTRIVYPGRDKPAPFADFHKYIRLYNRTETRFSASLAHDEVPPTGDVIQLQADMFHKSYRNVAHILTKTVSYYELQKSENKKIGNDKYIRVLFEFPFQFFKYYFIRRHVFGGFDGFVYSTTLAVGRWMRIFILMGW